MMADVAAGDSEAFRRLYDATVDRVHSIALRILGDSALAEEVTHQVYMHAWRAAQRQDPAHPAALASIYAACHARAVDALRSRTDTPELADSGGRPELECLLPIERELVAFAFYRGLGYADLAARFGLTLNTVKGHLFRARRKIRDAGRSISARIAP